MVDKSQEWINNDAWKKDTDINWDRLDYYVERGYLTPEERDLVHAYASLKESGESPGTYSSGQRFGGKSEYSGSYKSALDAELKFVKVDDEHKKDPEFDKKDPKISAPKNGVPPPDGSNYHAPPVNLPEAPKVPGAEGDGHFNGKDRIAVNTQALSIFADNIDKLRSELVDPLKVKTNDLDVRPGGFNVAYKLRQKITTGKGDSDPGLKTNLSKYVTELSAQLGNIRDEVRKLVADYDNTEDLNKLGAEKLNTIMNDSFSYIDKNSQKPGS
ncbi:hypothetical protein ACFWY9_38540 [Amycolatopsis sp. NPDC059027]|uniref:hypothetical protein n=1 Tax=Amycolatopsis sp. NPDC059027 TaxID=3346709 RepID=UPI00366F6026